jgi:hypothetical protein
MNKFTEDTVALAYEIQAVCNNHMAKHRTKDATIQTIWALADLLGIYIALGNPPDGILDDILEYVRKSSERDVSNIPTLDVNELQ